ncbi:outer dense fiber protein 3-like protein 2 isoform X1 [Drosophila sechellia]|uniref:GM18739 n=3 Tax=melanogaster subgroup TaxID=32351 RepID=B4HWV9_DROSE|nr:outer dense fiber protein 3-like protein 2 isoform X1 [Drosophila sechellia]XP_033156832.1 outer dense fiber protein 3-like protein 2 isoform X1 [Drosophila mauritiana]EDW52504.1 GM18739 [Drosophila sechellia]
MSRNYGPGPGAYMLPSSFGQKGPQFSFGRRIDRKRDEKPGPGPAAYKVDKVTRYGNAVGPQFSMYVRNSKMKPLPIRLS